MEISVLAQWASLFSSIAIVLLALFIIPVTIQMGRQLHAMTETIGQLKKTLDTVERESGEFIRTATDVSKQAQRSMDDIEKITFSARHWTKRVDCLIDGANYALEPSVLSLIQGFQIVRAGTSGFLRALSSSKSSKTPNKENGHE